MAFRILGEIHNVQVIASGRGLRIRRRLQRVYGGRKWRKMKGEATVEMPDGKTYRVELHWYEAHGVGRKEFKIKRILG